MPPTKEQARTGGKTPKVCTPSGTKDTQQLLDSGLDADGELLSSELECNRLTNKKENTHVD